LIFLTVGTQMTFDRLVRAVDEAVGKGAVNEEILAQVGHGGYRGEHMKCVETIEREEYERTVRNATALIAHAGMGTILMAAKTRKPVLVMPRLARLNEVVNDHQVDTARKFAQLGYVLVAEDENQIRDRLAQLPLFTPEIRTPNVDGITERIREFLDKQAGCA